MGITVTANTTNLRRRQDAMRSMNREARTSFLRVAVSQWANTTMETAPKDTRRYARGWGLAAQAVGSDHVRLPALQRSRYIEQYVEAYEFVIARMGADLAEVRRRLAENDGAPAFGTREYSAARSRSRRVGLSSRARQRLEQKASRLLERIRVKRQELRDFLASEHAIVIGAGPVFRAGESARIGLHASWTKPSVRLTVYGGTGTLRHGSTRTVAVLTNKEPHASTVEYQVTARALRALDSDTKAREAYLGALARGRSTSRWKGRSWYGTI